MDKKHIVIATDNVFFKNHFRDFFDQDNYEVSYFDLNVEANLTDDILVDSKSTANIQNAIKQTFLKRGTVDAFVNYWEEVVDRVSVGYTWTERMKDKSEIAEWVDRSRDLPRFFECNEIRAKMTVHADGNIVPCCEDYDDLMILGNVNSQSLKEVWLSDKSKNFRQDLCQEAGNQTKYELCKDCELTLRHKGDDAAFEKIKNPVL